MVSRRVEGPTSAPTIGLLALALLATIARADEGPRAESQFRQTVLPLLKAKCFPCHGDDPRKVRGELDMRARANLLAGGVSGEPALVPGDPAQSRLYVAVTRQDDTLVMPPKDNDGLSADELTAIRQWIAAGAPWPEDGSNASPEPTEGVRVATRGGRSQDWTDRSYDPDAVWAWRPVERPEVPTDFIDPTRVLNPIDAFIQHRLRQRGITALAPPAGPRALLRRLTLDLTGLPPGPNALEVPLRDLSATIDRLLASPHYGEQAARLWLDVVRYADSAGFSNDFERPNAWRYRDYVVRSFNQDKPYDRFVVEQLAGDELDPDDPELLIATGFLRMGPWEHTAMSVAIETRQQFLDDVTHAVGVTFLGQGLRCARCHDHKFDPVPTQDYYRLQAVFAPVQFAERPAPFLASENASSFAMRQAEARRRLGEVATLIARIERKSRDAITDYLKSRGVARAEDLPEAERPRKQFFGLTAQERSEVRIHQRKAQQLEREAQRYEPLAFAVYDGPFRLYNSPKPPTGLPRDRTGTAAAVHVLLGGSLAAPAEAVSPGALSARWGERPPMDDSHPIPEALEGRRLALARWITAPDNPFTARVIVNRIWQQHFGRGLVATPNNLGVMGARPSHPELLDWLAAWFIDNGWSIKRLHKLILTSATYQQGGEHPERSRLIELDPNNELLGRFAPRRLTAEEVRDGQLAASGELNPALGGPPVFPEVHWEVALQPRHVMGSVAPAYQPSATPAERHRRTLYAIRIRTLADPMLEVFNRPGSDVSCERRDESTVVPQALTLFNGAASHDRALAMAARLEREATGREQRIQRAFRLLFGRAATTEEVDLCAGHVARLTAQHRDHPPEPTPPPRSVERHMVEEMTGEAYSWVEVLDRMADFQPDLKPWDVGPETRALADLCLVLMNTNEFLYVR